MTFGITAGQAFLGGTALLGGLLSSKGATSAAQTQASAATQSADTQAQAAREALALQEKMFERQIGLQEPWRAAGVNALTRMQGGAFAQPEAFKFGTAEFQADPGYAFRLSEGQKALERSAAARGGLISGGALKAATGYGQEMGSQEFARARERALSNYGTNVARSDTGYNRLAGLAGVGQTATSALGSAAGQYGTAGANLITGAGQAIGAGQYGAGQSMAAGQLGAGNTWNNALGNIGSAYQTNQMLNRFYPVGGSSGSVAPSSNAMDVQYDPYARFQYGQNA